ncbi:MAG: NAD(P)/FAD-dependent oxidoreductase [Rhodothermales bacterium]|nr:NAD(P)/FAD-dependent oxidoreductase [Rhodothermales bacterium]
METSNGQAGRPRVVIIGAGFAGLQAARVLGGADVDVVVVDRNNYHKFQPLLYQVATAGLEPDEIAHNAREIFRGDENVTFRLGTVQAIDAARRRLTLRSGPPLDYDALIVAAGAVTNTFGVEGVQEHAFPLKNVPDAIDLRNHTLRLFEQAEREPAAAPDGALTFVIVGGGPTGVEMAGALVELFDVMKKDYRRIDTTGAEVHLIEMQADLLPSYPPPLRRYTRRVLERRGVRVRTETTVARVEAGAVHLEGGEAIPTQTLIWAAGVRGHPVGETLPVEAAQGGRVPVAPDLSVAGHPEIFVVGDLSGAEGADGEPLPQVAQVAIQQGRHAARQILRRQAGQPTEPFRYTDLGQMATIGRHAAVAEFPGGVTVKGTVAWLLWAFIHIWKLVGFRNRLNVFVNWIYNYFTFDRNARLILEVVPIPEALPEEVEETAARIKRAMDEREEER